MKGNLKSVGTALSFKGSMTLSLILSLRPYFLILLRQKLMLHHDTTYVKKVMKEMKEVVTDYNAWDRPKLDTLNESLAFKVVLAQFS